MYDLSGRVCLVTGATRGIGRATAMALAQLGATVLVHGRDAARVDKACRDIDRSSGRAAAHRFVADLSALAEVRRLARDILERHERLDVLINNAGGATRQRIATVDGLEWQFAVNHLAPFVLTNLLLDRLGASAPARIVTVSSNAHRGAAIDFDDLQFQRRKYSGLRAYSQSKLANILFTRELARRLAGVPVTANCLHPGVVSTHIFSGMGAIGTLFGWLIKPFVLSPAQGARTSVYLASSPDVATVSGKYFADCRESSATPAAYDEPAARRLWDVSAELTGLREQSSGAM